MSHLPTTSYDGSRVRRRGAGVLLSDAAVALAGSSSCKNGAPASKKEEEEADDDKLHAFSCYQKIDWALGWWPRQVKRLCSNRVAWLAQLSIPPWRRRRKLVLGAAAMLSVTFILVRIKDSSARRSVQYRFQIVFPKIATRDLGTKFRYPFRNITVPSAFLHGALDVASLRVNPDHPFQRTIQANDFAVSEHHRSDGLTAIPYQYWYDEDLEDLHFSCRRPSWAKLQFLNCNTFHEVSLSRDYQDKGGEARLKAPNYQDFDNYLVNHGFYRDVWVNNMPAEGTTSILKTTRFQFDFGWRNMFDVHREALIMERLTKFPNIVTAYGHCGTSVLTEALPHEVERYVVPGTGFKVQQRELHRELHADPQNQLSATERLETALEMAESIAVLHGFRDGVIVHDDIQLQQWLRAADGTLKLGDFNRATILDWNDKEKRYCKYNRGETFGNYRAPEEFDAGDLDEKIDVYSFSNNIYCLLTGLWPFYENEDDAVVQRKVSAGDRPFLDNRQNRSWEERQLIDIMKRGWEHSPDERIDIFEAVRLLREASKA